MSIPNYSISIGGSNNVSSVILSSENSKISTENDSKKLLKAQDIINNYLEAQNNSLDNIPRYACQRIYVPSFHCIADCVFDLQTQRSCVHTKFNNSFEIIDIHNINGVNIRYMYTDGIWQKVGLSDASANIHEPFYNRHQEGHGLLATTQLANLKIPLKNYDDVITVSGGFIFGISGEKPIQEDAYLINLAVNNNDNEYVTKVLYSKKNGYPIRRYIKKPLTGYDGVSTRSWESPEQEMVQEIICLTSDTNTGMKNVILNNNKSVRLFLHDFEITNLSNSHRNPVAMLDPSGGTAVNPGNPYIIYYNSINEDIFNTTYDVNNIDKLKIYNNLTNLNDNDVNKLTIELDNQYTIFDKNNRKYLIGSKIVNESYYNN